MTILSKSRGDSHRSWTLIGVITGAAFLLSACEEAEVILPGKREDVRSVLQTELVTDGSSAFVANEARNIALGNETVNADWAQGIGTQEYRVANAALGANPKLLWSAKIGAGDSRKQRITADPVIADGLIYTLDASSLVSATSTTGATIWSRDVRPERDSDGDATGGGLVVYQGVVFVSIGYGELVALDAATGDLRWTQQLDATGSGQPVAYDGLVYVLAGDDTGWAIEADSGRIAWRIGGSESVANVLGAPAPIIADDLAIFGFGSGELQAVFRRGGLRRWDASVLGERPGRALSKVDDVTGSPVANNGVLYAGNQAGRMIAVEVNSGNRIWTASEGAIGPMWPTGDSVFAVTDRNELVRLDASDGTKIWGYKLPNFVKDRPRRISEVFAHHGPILAGGRVFVTSNDGKIRGFDPRDGSLVNSIDIPSGATTSAAVAGGTLYVVGKNGQLHAFR